MNDIVLDGDGNLWIATAAGGAVFDGKDTWVPFTSKNSGIPSGNIVRVAVSRSGDVYFGSDSKGVAHLQGFVMPVPAAEVAQAEEEQTSEKSAEKEEQSSAEQASSAQEERVRINPHLSEGYVTITLESPSATVTFTNRSGKVVKTVANYKSGQKIQINKLAKGMYTVGVQTPRGLKNIKFNLK